LTQILSDAGTFNFAYDSVGRRVKMSLSNRTFTNYNYDAGSRLTNLTHKTSSGSIIDSFGFTHDEVGNRVTKTETDKKYTYSYDAVYRLLQALPTDHKGRHEYDHETETFSYDSVGNRLKGPKKRDDYTYNKGNQLTSDRWHTYEHDKNGNLIKKTDLHGGEIYTYAYDYENRLTKVEIQRGHKVKIVTFTYDPFGRRISKSVHREEIEENDHDGDSHDDHEKRRTTYYFYDNENIIMEYNQKGKVTARYVHGLGIDEPLAVEKGRHAYYYHADGLGSIVGLTNQWGRVVQRYDYDSFGNMKPHWHLIKQPYTYTGREYDTETGLYYYKARYYHAKIGRFLSKDPIGLVGGINLYTYVVNNPINFRDPFGLYGEDVHFYKTLVWAIEEAGIEPRIALRIAAANQRFDDALLTMPELPWNLLFGTPLHFQSTLYSEIGLSQALDQGNIEMFGNFLHMLQDSFSHRGLNPLSHAVQGSRPDQYCEGSKRDEATKEMTIFWLQEFERRIGKKYHPVIRSR
jgi:RHS repeat-associated protein